MAARKSCTALLGGCRLRCRRGRCRRLGVRAVRAAEEAEELRIRRQHHRRPGVVQRRAVGIHRPVEVEEGRIALGGIGESRAALGLALTAQDFLAAIGLVLVVEGLVYGGFPGLAKRLAGEVLSTPENVLRIVGLAAIAIGVGIVWLVRG